MYSSGERQKEDSAGLYAFCQGCLYLSWRREANVRENES
jgi:hypothetical protein